MRNLFKILLAVCAVGLGTTSCLKDFENTNVSYPTDAKLGYFKSKAIVTKSKEKTDSVFYTTVITKGSLGDTIIYTSKVSPKSSGEAPGVVVVGENAKYDQKTGVLMSGIITNNPTTGWIAKNGYPAEMAFTKVAVAKAIASNEVVTQFWATDPRYGLRFLTIPQYEENTLPELEGIWIHKVKVGTRESVDFILRFNPSSDEIAYSTNGQDWEELEDLKGQDGKYTFDGGHITFTFENGFEFAIGKDKMVLEPLPNVAMDPFSQVTI